jgi:hypothetical protein
MRRGAVALALVLAGCASPEGAERRVCDAEWLDVTAVAAESKGVRETTLPVECFEEVGNRRVRMGFTLPAGPDCHVLQRVDLVESAEAVSITLISAVNDDPNAGACPDEQRRVVTEVDLASPIDERRLLDGSAR